MLKKIRKRKRKPIKLQKRAAKKKRPKLRKRRARMSTQPNQVKAMTEPILTP